MTIGAAGVTPNGERFQPVLMGADIGIYALARSFHEQYGVRSIVVSLTVTGPVADSTIIENVVLGADATPEQMVEALLDVARRFAGPEAPTLLLLANTDWLVRFLVDNRAVLEQSYIVPFLDAALLRQLADKARFAELCGELGISVPRTVVQDFASAGDGGWWPEPVDLPFPVIAKAADSADYERLHFAGKKKVYEIEDEVGLAELYARLIAVGFSGRFVIQEMVPGDDTQMRSVTCYVDTRGVVTLSCCAHVLLEEHTPSGLGNPAAMITGRWDGMLGQAHRLLTATGYTGFANFDVKVDPRDGTAQFFEVNPRIGRNNYYVTAAGANPVRFLVEDRVDGTAIEPVVVEREILYSIVPFRLLRRYVLDRDLAATVNALIRRGATAHPLRYRADRRWRRRLYVALAGVNQVRKFRTYYPEVTRTGL